MFQIINLKVCLVKSYRLSLLIVLLVYSEQPVLSFIKFLK